MSKKGSTGGRERGSRGSREGRKEVDGRSTGGRRVEKGEESGSGKTRPKSGVGGWGGLVTSRKGSEGDEVISGENRREKAGNGEIRGRKGRFCKLIEKCKREVSPK